MSAWKQEDDRRKKLRQPNVAKIKRALSEFIHLPRDRDGLHLHRDDGTDARELEPAEILMLKGGARRYQLLGRQLKLVDFRGHFGCRHLRLRSRLPRHRRMLRIYLLRSAHSRAELKVLGFAT